MNELPISEERMRELREPLSDEAQMVIDLVIATVDGGSPEEAQEVADRITELEPDVREQVAMITGELMKAYERSLKESESYISIGERAMEDIERAREVDPSVNTLGEAAAVLKEHGIATQVSDDELNIELKVPAPETWVHIPRSEVMTDENGIPTKKACPKGFGVPSGDEIIKLDRKQAEALRLVAKELPFEEWMKDMPPEAAKDLEESRQNIEDIISTAPAERPKGEEEVADEEWAELKSQAYEALNVAIHKDYLANLAMKVKEQPEPQGIIDFYKQKNTAAARRFIDRNIKPMFDEEEAAYVAELFEQGVLVHKPGDPNTLLPGPNYEQWQREKEDEEEGEE